MVALPFAINLVANLIFTPIQFGMRGLDPEARLRVEKLRTFRDAHWVSKTPGMAGRAVQANREINQILSLSKIPDDPRYWASRLAFDLQAVASERLELETRVSPYGILPGNANPASSDPFLESSRDKMFSRLSTLREEERELQQRLKREQQRQFVSPTQSLTDLYDASK